MGGATSVPPADGAPRRRRAALAAAISAVAVLVLSVLLMVFNADTEGVSGTTTVTTVSEVDKDGTKTTKSVEVVTPGRDTSLIGRTLDTGASPLLIQLLVATLAAFAAGAVVQRVWLGEYGITIGPVSLPALPPVSQQAATVAVDLITESPEFVDVALAPGMRAPAPTPQFYSVENERLAMVSIRAELEQRLRKLARVAGLDGEIEANRIPDRLIGAGVLTPEAGTGLRKLLDIGDRILKGAEFDKRAAQSIRDTATDVLYVISEIARRLEEERKVAAEDVRQAAEDTVRRNVEAQARREEAAHPRKTVRPRRRVRRQDGNRAADSEDQS